MLVKPYRLFRKQEQSADSPHLQGCHVYLSPHLGGQFRIHVNTQIDIQKRFCSILKLARVMLSETIDLILIRGINFSSFLRGS